ncbi:MAG TPA: hypothetical protein VFA20_12305 [Myxococcaceae bacterium]|nr:hypothetical protein [Myxococcaceae bacterium]
MYKAAQLIAYEVPTESALPAGQCTLDGNKLVEDVQNDKTFTSAMAALSADARARVQRMLAVMDLAFGSASVTKAAETLKVFMAPEFYFRPQQRGAKSRSYEASDMTAAQQAFRAVFSQAKLQHWVFVAGSLVWNMSGKVAASSGMNDLVPHELMLALDELAAKDLVYNTVIVGLGGSGVQLYDKVNYSDADDIAQGWRPLKDYCLQSPTQNLIKADNLLIGIEVCFDHQCGQLALSYEQLKATYPSAADAPVLDLQLLTACGMEVQFNRVVAGQDRLVFRVDGTQGAFYASKRFDHSEIQGVAKAGAKHALKMLDPVSSPKPWADVNAPLDAAVLQGDYALDVAGAEETVWKGVELTSQKLGTSFKQRLVVYPDYPLLHLG